MANCAFDDSRGTTTWHLCWQAAVGRDIFVSDDMYEHVRVRVLNAHAQAGRVLMDYALLPRELHLISRIEAGDSPGKVARAIGNIVARWARQAVPVRSPVFAGPFHALPLATEHEVLVVSRLLAWRPVSLGLCRAPSHYPHAAIRVTLGMRPGRGFNARPLLDLLDGHVPTARKELRKWLARRPSDVEVGQWELMCGLTLATSVDGTGRLLAKPVRADGAARLVAAGADGIGGAIRLLERWVVFKVAGAQPIDLHRSHTATAAHARALVACLAMDGGLCSAAMVARHFGRAKATLSEQMAACRRDPTDRALLLRPLAEIALEAMALARSHG